MKKMGPKVNFILICRPEMMRDTECLKQNSYFLQLRFCFGVIESGRSVQKLNLHNTILFCSPDI
jgi:hypothetical protein